MNKTQQYPRYTGRSFRLLHICLLLLLPLALSAHDIKGYSKERPIVVACDWNKAPYEFLNDQGEPAGSNIDILEQIFKELNLPYRFVMKEWGNAVKTFESGKADLILANARRYSGRSDYFITRNIINYNRIVAATLKDTTGIISIHRLVRQGVVMKPEDASKYYFMAEDSSYLDKIDFQSPKTALMSVEAGDYTYFVWGEEPIKWKIKELNMTQMHLVDVNIPISEIHVIGRDRDLIDAIDDHYSRMKQRGEVEQIVNRWMHPERVTGSTPPKALYTTAAVLLLAAVIWLIYRVSKAHVLRATRESTDLNQMIMKALEMGNFHIMEYDIKTDRMTNKYGHVLPDEGLTLQEFTSRIHPSQQQEFGEKMERLLSGRERKLELDKRWNAGTEGQPRWLTLEGHAVVELDEHGEPAYVINAVHNITHDLEEEQLSYERAKRYQVLSNMPTIATSFYDKDGYLIEANDAMSALCGFQDPKVERFWRKVCMFDIPLFRNAYSPESRDDLYICQHMNYPDMGIDSYIEFTVHPLFNSKGELINYFCAVFDVTDEYRCNHQLVVNRQNNERADQLLKYYDEQLTGLVESGRLYMWHSHIADHTIWFYHSMKNRQLFQTSFDDFFSHIVPSEQDVARYYLTNTSLGQPEMNAVFHFTDDPMGSGESWYNMKSTPLYDADGHIIGHRGISYNLTRSTLLRRELTEVTERAKASGQLKSGFMASMTHELRTPLNAIMGFTDVLRMTTAPEERTEYIRIVRNACDMLVRLINDIFEASTITDEPSSISPAPVDFAVAFDDICLMLEKRVTEPGLSFIKDNPYPSLKTTLDMARIQQIITNFVTNAVKFTREGHIRVGYRLEHTAASPQEAQLYIYCEDTGAGIPKDKQQEVFKRFVKLDEYVQGTGLGLNICKSIAERCGGTIGVESDGPATGSTFWVRIPCEVESNV